MSKLFSAVVASLFMVQVFAANPELATDDSTKYEMLVITAKPGKLDHVHAWFRAHHDDVLAKHGATALAFLVPLGENRENKLLAIHRYPGTAAVNGFHRVLANDPLWKPLDPTTDSPELLVDKIETLLLEDTEYSPTFVPSKAVQPRVFELRSYTSPTPEKLKFLHGRFREHTMKLFAKHGMENLIYWQPLGTKDADTRLVYLLGHKSQDSAKESFAAFRKDPDWLVAKKASEERAGGSLTNPEGGVVSEFFAATDYSPLQ